MQDFIYSDVNSFTPKINSLLYDINEVFQNIEMILTTNKTRRIFKSEFGSNLDQYLMELMTDETADDIMDEVIFAIERWYPRVTVLINESKIDANYEEHTYDIFLVLIVKGFGNQKFEYKGSLEHDSN